MIAIQTSDHAHFLNMKKGDKDAFELLFKTYYNQLVRFAKNYVKDTDTAEDLVQEVFVKIWERREQIEIQTAVKSYLFMAVKNHCLTKLKVADRNLSIDEDTNIVMDMTSNQAELQTNTIHLKTHINEALDKLPPKCAVIFKLSRFENMSYKEIADELQISIKTVENQMGKALSIMRTYLAPYLTALGLPILFLFYFLNK